MSENQKLELFKGHAYSSFLEMGKEVYLYPGRFYKYFFTNSFISALSKDKEKYSAYLYLVSRKEIPDVFLFHMSYLLNPYMSLRYHHFIFQNYKELGEQMRSYGPTADVYLKDLLVYHLLSEYMEKQGDDHRYESLYRKVKKREREAEDDENSAYWELMYDLTGSSDLYYEGQSYSSPHEFFSTHLSMSSLLSLSSSLEGKLVLVYLKRQGKEREVASYSGTVASFDEQEKRAKASFQAKEKEEIRREKPKN